MKPKPTTLIAIIIGCLAGAATRGLAIAQTVLSTETGASSAVEAQHVAEAGQGRGADDPQAVFQKAVVTLERYRSVSAKARQRVDLFGKELVGTGTYLEERAAEGLLFRLELKFPLGDEPCVLLQVCNGRYLWRYEKWLAPPIVTRVDTARVAQALEEKGDMPQPGKIGNWLGLGGMPRLLRSVNNAFDFKTAEATELPGGFPAIRLQGTWKPDRLAHFVPDTGGSGAGESERMQRLPSHVPHYLVVFLGRDDLFPYRLEFRRKAPPPLPGQPPAEDSALVTLELYEVSLNGPIARERFFYDPGPLEYTEQTDRFLESLGVKKK